MRRLLAVLVAIICWVALPLAAQQASAVDGVTLSNISAIDGVTKANISAVNGLTISSGATPTWVEVDTIANTSCAAGTTCTISGLTSTTAGSVLAVSYLGNFVASPGISSVSGGGGTWTTSASLYNDTSGEGVIAQAYNVTGTGGATSVTVTMGASISGTWTAVFSEWKCTANCGAGSALDVFSTGAGSSTSTTSVPGGTITGVTNGDLCEQLVNDGAGPGSPTNSWVFDTTYQLIAYNLSISSPPTPPFTIAQTSGGYQTVGACFK